MLVLLCCFKCVYFYFCLISTGYHIELLSWKLTTEQKGVLNSAGINFCIFLLTLLGILQENSFFHSGKKQRKAKNK